MADILSFHTVAALRHRVIVSVIHNSSHDSIPSQKFCALSWQFRIWDRGYGIYPALARCSVWPITVCANRLNASRAFLRPRELVSLSMMLVM